MGEVFSLELSQSEKLVLLAMADHAKDDGTRVFPSVARIAWKVDLSTRQVQRIIAQLKIKGLLVIMRKGNSRFKFSTEYRINLSAGERKEVFRGDISRPKDDTIMSHKNDIPHIKRDIVMSPQPSSYKHYKEPSAHTQKELCVSEITLEICKQFTKALQVDGKHIRSSDAYAYALFRNETSHESIRHWLKTQETGYTKLKSNAELTQEAGRRVLKKLEEEERLEAERLKNSSEI